MTETAAPAEWIVEVGDATTTAVFEPATGGQARALFVCAHGAGGHMSDKGMLQLVRSLRKSSLDVVRFNFLYREKKSGRPDPMPRLEECFSAVVARARRELSPQTLMIGGRSMGGRAASMLAARGFDCDGILLFAYPLHPAGQQEKLRDAHLASIDVPVLCFNGTRDALCNRDLMEKALQTVKSPWTMHWLEGADHGFHMLKSSAKTDQDLFDEVAASTVRWVREITDTPGLGVTPTRT